MILVVAEQREGVMNRVSWEAVVAAQEMAVQGFGPIKVVVMGSTVAGVADEVAAGASTLARTIIIAGVTDILFAFRFAQKTNAKLALPALHFESFSEPKFSYFKSGDDHMMDFDQELLGNIKNFINELN